MKGLWKEAFQRRATKAAESGERDFRVEGPMWGESSSGQSSLERAIEATGYLYGENYELKQKGGIITW